jgi:hypothetical protein
LCFEAHLSHLALDPKSFIFFTINLGWGVRANDAIRKQIYGLCLGNTGHINNWDLVDGTVRRARRP